MNSNPQGLRFPQPHPPTSAFSQGRAEFTQANAISSRTNELTRHRDFILYSHVIQALLVADKHELDLLKVMREQPESPLFRGFYGNIYSTPPEDIFSLILLIRADESWDAMKQDVLIQVNNAQPLPASFGTNSKRSGHQYTRPRRRLFHSPSGPQQSHPGFVSQHPGRGAGSSGAAGSPTSAEGHLSKVNSGRTAPPGYCFYCPSKNCKKFFIKQGHYENHLWTLHHEIAGAHDPADDLRKIPSSGQPSTEGMSEPGAARPPRGATALSPPRPVLATSMPHPSNSASPLPQIVPSLGLNPHTVGSYTLQSGTSPQTSLPQKRPPDTGILPSDFEFQNDEDWNSFLLSDEQQFLQTPLSQTNSNSNQSFFSMGSHTGS
ncbi:uncharacterized protein Z520_09153 [Fonsecaea multimorphosa CBS 102226]|uniref:Uncharacterized protein n=1 Tax=Fonsecaea multimorphosa CBS 102226 TaxID=1442371 RepID=A0A0D2IDL8_9EURO|nr:uncharacterized protein Z520_09153 [Fonsecaea multimorphosa CBS 102226]KIX95236.1 hypothetical protein Z520_09153 [Fonsecaea multimorphosa CBS 102226]OAL17271.1 hypothetical protein AYO22_11836 [Fonsecaea multimorphosa]